MTSAFFGLNTALSALQAEQAMLDTTAHNTANANTPGYSRQVVSVVASPPYTIPAFNRSGLPGQIGTGVTVASITRVRDAFLDQQLRQQVGIQGMWTTRQDELAKMESLASEPSTTGLGSGMSSFWNAWEDLAADPTSAGARTTLVEQAGTLAQQFNSLSRQVSSLIAGEDYQVTQQVGQVNDLASRIASLNAQIKQVSIAGDHANDLEDQRDQLLQQLSSIVSVSVQPQTDGTVTVLAGGTDLVSGDRARAMTTVPDANGHAVPSWASGGAVDLGSGQLSAYVTLRDTTLPGYLAQLNTLAKGIADAVNGLQQSGVDQNGQPGQALFTYTAGNEAGSLAASSAVAADPTLIAASAAAGQPSDGSVAGQVADLRTSLLFAGGTQSPSDMYSGLVGKIGADSQQAQEMAANEGLVVDQLTQRQQSASGVSLDEEATNMIAFQHAYQAAARVMTTMDDVLDQLINHTGRVGL